MEDPTIFSLPNEVILMILDCTSYLDINRFGSTCKKFNELIKESQALWKKKFRLMVHKDVMAAIDDHLFIINWFEEVKKYIKLKRTLISYLLEMPAKQYKNFCNSFSHVSTEDLKHFFDLALADKSSLGESIYILQEFIRKGNTYLNNDFLIKPYNLTTVFYAKTVLQSLMHMYLSFYWELHETTEPMCPLEVINFFVQWVDPINIHSLNEVYKHMTELKTVIKKDLVKYTKWKEDELIQDLVTDDDVVRSITKIIYKQRYITLMPHINLDTLDTVQVLKNHCGNMIAMGAIYQNVAHTLGLNCFLIAFPNHFILELERRDEEKDVVYKIALDTGECRPKGRCPFTQTYFPVVRNVYCSKSFTNYIATEFLSSMGEIRDWYTVNVERLLVLLRNKKSKTKIDMVRYLNTHTGEHGAAAAACSYEPDYFNMYPDQLSMLHNFVLPIKDDCDSELKRKNILPKTRDSNLKYAVGMICYHIHYNYVCLIYRWDNSCFDTHFNPIEIRALQFGIKQPFYHVIAMDQSKRYVPQENLVVFDRPTRLYHLEDLIAPDFSHFNGFAYVPNEEKAKEYPEDIPVSNLFKNHYYRH